MWHRRLGHLGIAGVEELTKHGMGGLDLDCRQQPKFCESCAKGKSHQLSFRRSTEKRMSQPLELVHSVVCGKVGAR